MDDSFDGSKEWCVYTCDAGDAPSSTNSNCIYCGKELHFRNGAWWTWDSDFFTTKRPQNGNTPLTEIRGKPSFIEAMQRHLSAGGGFQRIVCFIFACMFLCSCAHQAVTQPVGPGGAIASIDNQYVYFTAQGHELWLKEGVPVDLFTLTTRGWAMTPMQWHQGNSIRLKDKNP